MHKTKVCQRRNFAATDRYTALNSEKRHWTPLFCYETTPPFFFSPVLVIEKSWSKFRPLNCFFVLFSKMLMRAKIKSLENVLSIQTACNMESQAKTPIFPTNKCLLVGYVRLIDVLNFWPGLIENFRIEIVFTEIVLELNEMKQ